MKTELNDKENYNNSQILLITLSPETNRTSEENLGLGYLAAVLRYKKYTVNIIDGWLYELDEEQILEKIFKNNNLKIIGISCYMSNNIPSIKLAKKIKERRPQIKLICGGFGPSFNKEMFLKNNSFDVVIHGEGEDTIKEVVDYYIETKNELKNIKGISFIEDEKIITTEKRELISDLDLLPFPDRDTMTKAIERKSTVNVLTARGCMGNCSFCSVSAFGKLSQGNKWRGRSIKNIVDELEILYKQGVIYVKFIDDSFIDGQRDYNWAKVFYEEISRRNIKMCFRGSIRADKVDCDVIGYLKLAGFRSFSCGIENGSKQALKRMNKIANLDINEKALEIFKENNIYLQAGYILFDNETTFQELKENYEFLLKHNEIITKGIFSEMYAANGTDFTKKLKKKNELIDIASYDNNKYEIENKKVKQVYNSLKIWHKSHMKIYDMVIDPITSPKAINDENMNKFYRLSRMLKKLDIEVMFIILLYVQEEINDKNLKDIVEEKIENTRLKYCEIEKIAKELYLNAEIEYDAKENPFIVM